MKELKRLMPAAALIGLWKGVLDAYLLNPRYQGYRMLGRCRSCEGYFHQKDVREGYCCIRCKWRSKSLTLSLSNSTHTGYSGSRPHLGR